MKDSGSTRSPPACALQQPRTQTHVIVPTVSYWLPLKTVPHPDLQLREQVVLNVGATLAPQPLRSRLTKVKGIPDGKLTIMSAPPGELCALCHVARRARGQSPARRGDVHRAREFKRHLVNRSTTKQVGPCKSCPVSKEDTRGQHHSAQTLYVVQPGRTRERHTPWPSPSTAMRPGALEKAIASISRYSRKA